VWVWAGAGIEAAGWVRMKIQYGVFYKLVGGYDLVDGLYDEAQEALAALERQKFTKETPVASNFSIRKAEAVSDVKLDVFNAVYSWNQENGVYEKCV